MLAGYVAAGFEPAAFWKLTPRLYQVHMRGAHERMQREHDARVWLAWHTAFLPQAKRKPRYEDLLSKKPAARQPLPWKAQYARWMAYVKARSSRGI